MLSHKPHPSQREEGSGHDTTMTMDATYKECRSDWSHQVSAMATTLWLQCDQTLPLCEGCGLRD